MFLENEIEELGYRLLKKAGLEENTSFSITAPQWMNDANIFELRERIIYSIPERNYYEFKQLSRFLWEKFGSGSSTFLDVQKINISHEMGHALQTNLKEKTRILLELKSPETLAMISSIEELSAHVEQYRSLLLAVEKEAWNLGWELIQDETNKELFDLIRNHALISYQEGDLLNEEREFFEAHEILSSGKTMDLINRQIEEEVEFIAMEILFEGATYKGEMFKNGDDHELVEPSFSRYNHATEEWEDIPDSFDWSVLNFAIEDFKQNVKKV